MDFNGRQVTNRYGSNVGAELIAKLAKEEQAKNPTKESGLRGGRDGPLCRSRLITLSGRAG